MSRETIGMIILLGSLIGLILIRIPIAFSLGVSAFAAALYLDIPLMNLVLKMVTSMQNFIMVACPFFIIMAQIMTDGGVTQKLMKFCNLIVGRIPGGTAMVNILVSMFFGGISGSSTADVSSIGAMLIPAMIDEGYDPDYSVAVTVTSSLEGIMIPPSQNMLFYALAAGSGLSISTLLICGYMPGVLLTLGLMIPAFIIAKKRKYPLSEKVERRKALKITLDAIVGLFAIVIIVVGTTTGICSASESAGIAAVYAFLIAGFVYRSITFKQFCMSFLSAIPILAMSLGIIATSNAFSVVMSYLQVPTLLGNLLLTISQNPNVILFLMMCLMLFLGCFMDMGVLILISTPILYPIAVNILGLNPYHFGVVLVFGYAIGLCTPPVGMSMFIGCRIANIPVEKSIKAFVPFYLVMFALFILFAFCPWLSLCIPNAMGLVI